MAEKKFYDAVGSKGSTRGDGGPFWGRVYHYAGVQQVVDFRGQQRDRKETAMDDAAEWLDDNNLEAEADFS